MKKSIIVLLLPILLIITGCPVGLPHSVGVPGTEKIDARLVGSWHQSDPEKEVMKMTILKLDDYSIQVTVEERGSMFTEDQDVFKGWFTTLNNKQFVYFQKITDSNSSYYNYIYKFDGDKLITYDFGLLDGGVDSVTSTQSFRDQVLVSMQREEFLSDETVWTKY